MPSEVAEKGMKRKRQEASKKTSDTKCVKDEGKKQARQNQASPALSDGRLELLDKPDADAGLNATAPVDHLRAWFENVMARFNEVDMYLEVQNSKCDEEERHKRYLDYYRLATALAKWLDIEALKLRSKVSHEIQRRGLDDDYTEEWDLEILSIDETDKAIGKLARVWGTLALGVVHIYPEAYVPLWAKLVEKEENWDIVVNWINRAVYERCARQAMEGKCTPHVLQCDILKALTMESPVEPVSKENLSMIQGELNWQGLITPASPRSTP
ncbi:hypothetical protein AbraIFM66951_011014 [Aspergillus brasiliensis]|uniref:Uncharacterized protein n=1 Tax=Aspergillus brasiliensis TaxID=319629 RepID=A0A9W5YMJ8_9EURO|nr:hypothetical protein AbraCBS73388_003875 [Aspergillus brasiliensis]GKZ41733.1 hypothetical protein AbraIFM66951_011014 [Aspergillus brasiliensis]